jgi:hypothetical protein
LVPLSELQLADAKPYWAALYRNPSHCICGSLLV